jgi:ribonuclease I
MHNNKPKTNKSKKPKGSFGGKTKKEKNHNKQDATTHADQGSRIHNKSKRKKKNTQHDRHQSSVGMDKKFNNSPAASFLKTTLSAMVTSAAVAATSKLGDDNDRTASGKTGEFDLYLFAQSWAPRFCCISPEKCANENMQDLNDLSVHGVWPAYTKPDKNDRTFPAFCKKSSSTSGHSRKQHEWEKHGTCTGLSTTQYFEEESRIHHHCAFNAPKEILSNYVKDSVEVDELLSAFGGAKRAAIKTDAHCRLEEITTCWSKTPAGFVGEPIDCPDHVLASGRNSAIMMSNCSRVWLDSAGSCEFINGSMKSYLKTGVQKTPNFHKEQ